jgi:hypothetical protein
LHATRCTPLHSFYKNFSASKKKAFTKYAKKYTDGKKTIEAELEQLKKHCVVIRVLAHTQVCVQRRGVHSGCSSGLGVAPVFQGLQCCQLSRAHQRLDSSQVKKLGFGQKKAQLMEIQINGGSVAQKVDFAYGLFEKQVRAWALQCRQNYIRCMTAVSYDTLDSNVAACVCPPCAHRTERAAGVCGRGVPGQRDD